TAKKDRFGKTALALSAVAIAIALATGAGLWTWSKKQADTQNASSDSLATQLTSLQNQQQAQKAEFEKTLKTQADALAAAPRQQDAMARELDEVQKKVATISGSDAKTWQLAQADFLVKLAGRKLWSDQDATTAAALLKSADASLADMNDPSLITARRALTDDIAALASVTQVDYDGIILKLNQLSNQV
ncbi:uroporphyrinogen-III C-methyltransferase, partial [Escherichia coli]|uniref:uroporphyrinogen-III C-methyltransferase n=1 Tax=Escherichia coli TaxID=562 RepID=UPI001103A8C5